MLSSGWEVETKLFAGGRSVPPMKKSIERFSDSPNTGNDAGISENQNNYWLGGAGLSDLTNLLSISSRNQLMFQGVVF